MIPQIYQIQTLQFRHPQRPIPQTTPAPTPRLAALTYKKSAANQSHPLLQAAPLSSCQRTSQHLNQLGRISRQLQARLVSLLRNKIVKITI